MKKTLKKTNKARGTRTANVEIIDAYTRAQAIADGVLYDVSKMAREAGIKYPVAVSSAVWRKCVELTPMAQLAGCDLSGRLWDILWTLRCTVAVMHDCEVDELLYEMQVVTDWIEPWPVTLRAVCGPGDDSEHVITVLMPDED